MPLAELADGQRGWELSPGLAERLVARTGGLPLLVAAVVRGAADQDQLAAATVTASVAGTVRQLLASLDPAARRLAEAAAVLAEPTALSVLGQVADVPDPSAALTAAAVAGLLTEDEQGDIDSAHDLMAEAVRQGLTPVRRRDLHLHAARWTTGDRRLAHRAAASDRPDPVLATDLVAAADTARAALRYGVAATHRLRARAVSADPVERERLLVDALVDRVEAEDLDGAGELAAHVEQAPPGARRSLALGLLARERGQVGAARTLLRASLLEAESVGDRGAATRAALAGAVLEVLIGDGAAAMELLGHTEPPDGYEVATDVAATTGIALWLQGDLDQALAVLDGVERIPGGTSSEAELLAVSGMVRFYEGRPRQALADLDASVRMTHLWRPSTNQTRIYLLRSMTRFALGDWDGAAVDAAAARALAAGPTQPWSEALALAISVDVAAHRGQWEVAEDYLARATEGAPAVAQITDVVARHAVELAQARGDHDGVLALLDPLWSDSFVEAMSRTRQVRPMMVARIAALVAADRLRDAERAMEAYERTNARRPGGEVPAQLGRLRGLLAEARGDPKAAQAHYARDLTVPELDHFPLERARLLLDSGRLERTLGHRRQAVRQLTDARDILTRLRARPLLERCTRELAACGLPSRLDDPLALTAREEDVVALVQQGHTNKEVAAALFLTVKTVEYHLRNIYAKLGFASRSELRRLWPGSGPEDLLG
ncbi:MAG: LuxR C-terminal-related transcriptional regulator [Lapillicoccus sp.]